MLTGLIVLALGLGLLLGRLDRDFRPVKQCLAKLLLNLFYPLLIISTIPTRLSFSDLKANALLPLALALLLLVTTSIAWLLLQRWPSTTEARKRSFLFSAFLPNYSYAPLILSHWLWQDKSLAFISLAGVGVDILLWTFGIRLLRKQAAPRVWQIISQPAFLALLAAIAWLNFAQPLQSLRPLLVWLQPIAQLTMPLSMLLLGLSLSQKQSQSRSIWLAARDYHQQLLLALHLLFRPCLASFFLWLWPNALAFEAKAVLILIASMPAAIASAPLAAAYQADDGFCSEQIVLGHLLGVLTVGFWYGVARNWLL